MYYAFLLSGNKITASFSKKRMVFLFFCLPLNSGIIKKQFIKPKIWKIEV